MGHKKLVRGPRPGTAIPVTTEARRHWNGPEIKPCMAQNKLLHGEIARDSSEQLPLIGGQSLYGSQKPDCPTSMALAVRSKNVKVFSPTPLIPEKGCMAHKPICRLKAVGPQGGKTRNAPNPPPIEGSVPICGGLTHMRFKPRSGVQDTADRGEFKWGEG